MFAVCCVMSLTGCEAVTASVNDFIDNDANIGKNAPAVGGSIADIEALNQAAEESRQAEKTDEQKAQEAADAAKARLSERADAIIAEMTAEEKIAQMMLVKMPENPAANMSAYNFGGYVLYADDFKDRSPEEVKELTKEIKSNAKTAPFFAVDEEGGTVIRVSKFSQYRDEPFSSPQLLFQRGGTELLEIDAEEKAKLLKSLGINLNLAPVADISSDETSYIYPRTMGQGAEETAAGVSAIVRIFSENNLASCLKHFPGYGENTDTHTGSAHDSRELYEFYNRDFVPFEQGVEAGGSKTPSVMVGHTVYDSIDPDVPASLSAVIHNVLRERLGFEGVIISDDLGMDAVEGLSIEGSVYTAAVLAGNDLLCVSDYTSAYADLTAAYENGEITDDILDGCVKRVLIMKMEYLIIR